MRSVSGFKLQDAARCIDWSQPAETFHKQNSQAEMTQTVLYSSDSDVQWKSSPVACLQVGEFNWRKQNIGRRELMIAKASSWDNTHSDSLCRLLYMAQFKGREISPPCPTPRNKRPAARGSYIHRCTERWKRQTKATKESLQNQINTPNEWRILLCNNCFIAPPAPFKEPALVRCCAPGGFV